VGPVHVSATISKDGAQHWIRLIYLWIIAVVIGGMVLHTAADFVRKAAMQPATHAEARGPARLRMPLRLRLQHGLVMLSFPLLAYSGFALTTPESWWAAPLLHWETAHATRGITHRIAAIVLLVAVIWHVGNYFSKASRQREWMRGIWWKLSDARHFFAMLGWYVGLRREHPVSGRFSYIEKAEYWAFLWGIVLMAVTGLPLWFKDITLRYLPKWLTDVATSLHFYEAVLATLAILVWHMYWVVFDPDVYPMDMSWWHGRAPAARNAERIDDAEAAPPASPVAEAAVAAREDSGNRE
jgi:cytochrome b subunit of formate dehydrogenase